MAYPQIFLDWETATEERGREIGQKIGQKEKALSIALRLLHRRIGALNDALETRVMSLSGDQLGDLSEASLDFEAIDDLSSWLDEHPATEISS